MLQINNKSNIGIQTFFFILMSMMMIGIILFGLSKLFLVNDTISEQDRIDTKNALKTGFSYCEDPLNAGSYKSVNINSKMIGMVCILGDTINSGNLELDAQLQIAKDSGNNIVLINQNNIIDSFKVETNMDGCYKREIDGKIFKIKINC